MLAMFSPLSRRETATGRCNLQARGRSDAFRTAVDRCSTSYVNVHQIVGDDGCERSQRRPSAGRQTTTRRSGQLRTYVDDAAIRGGELRTSNVAAAIVSSPVAMNTPG